jgi:hypothetical protein
MRVKQKKNFTNPGKKEAYAVKTGLGHSTSTGNPDVSPFEGKDARVSPDSPNASGTRHSQATRAQWASPHRVRKEAGFGVLNHGGTVTCNASKE